MGVLKQIQIVINDLDATEQCKKGLLADLDDLLKGKKTKQEVSPLLVRIIQDVAK